MKECLLRIYDMLAARRLWLWSAFTMLLVPLIVLALSLNYNEDIMDFLPVGKQDREALDAFRSQPSAARLVLIVEGADGLLRDEAVDEISFRLSAAGHQLSTDPSEQLRELYAQLPYFISDSVYARLDSLFTPEAIRAALLRDKALLSTPGAGFLASAVQSDPLSLVSLSSFASRLSADRTYAFLDSPYGSTETRNNAVLVDSLNAVALSVAQQFPGLDMRWIGAPVIAVGNARRIKLDSLICIALSFILITLLLVYAFPRKRDLGFILLSVSFGWLVGMAALRLVTPVVSAMVLGIGSVLIGIAVNYPLHLLVHQRYTSSVRRTLQEVLSPLVVGNITTIGAFLALIPLKAAAMRHLGIFAASMLAGTILFCIFVLPHLMSAKPAPLREIKLPKRLSSFGSNLSSFGSRLSAPFFLLSTILALFLVFSPSRTPLFNPDPGTVNYMTGRQRADIAFFDSVANPMRHIAAHGYRADLWQAYWQTHDADSLIALVESEASQVGFRPGAFAPFFRTLTSWQPAQPFDFKRLTQGLNDNFNYIGIACSLVVFLFLWLSFRSLLIALIAFVPMVLSWVWIIAVMHLFGLQFNIVNIILATFIFGQGDDYTIFIVEGLLYERRTGSTILPQYRQSILLSALIMLIGIGILVFAVHPAMHSPGLVTLIGMSVVLFMAVTVPPLLFRLLDRLSPSLLPR